MRKVAGIFLLFAIAFLGASCEKQDPEVFRFTISPTLDFFSAESGKDIIFDISASSPDLQIVKLDVAFRLQSTLRDTFYSKKIDNLKDFTDQIILKIPEVSDTIDSYAYFYLQLSDGEVKTRVKKIRIYGGSIVLPEISEVYFYGSNTLEPSALDLSDNTAKYLDLIDSTIVDIIDTDTTQLSMSWVSFSEGRFVKFNGFDYSAATQSDLISAYNGGIKQEKVTGLAEGDVILFYSQPKNLYAAILIKKIRTASSLPDRYEINYKKVEL